MGCERICQGAMRGENQLQRDWQDLASLILGLKRKQGLQ
jgi:hypothetical protein